MDIDNAGRHLGDHTEAGLTNDQFEMRIQPVSATQWLNISAGAW